MFIEPDSVQKMLFFEPAIAVETRKLFWFHCILIVCTYRSDSSTCCDTCSKRISVFLIFSEHFSRSSSNCCSFRERDCISCSAYKGPSPKNNKGVSVRKVRRQTTRTKIMMRIDDILPHGVLFPSNQAFH